MFLGSAVSKVITRVREREAAAIERRIKMSKHPEIGSPEWKSKIEAEIRHAHTLLEVIEKAQKPTSWRRIFGKTWIYLQEKW